ncbi:MAG: hypothetical protein WCH52_04460 [Bacteroidota bacterium]
MSKFSRIFLISFIFILQFQTGSSQVSAVTFGKNRVQFKKFKWQYYHTENFNVYFYKGGQELAKYALQVAEKELPDIETAAEYSLQKRVNIILFNDYKDYQQTNIGLESDIINTGSTTKMVNNKMLIYFDANHADLKRQIREGIADVITKNLLFGSDLGEVASNQTLLDLPVWFTNGYIAYLGEHWNTSLDDELKSELLSGKYKKFSNFSFNNPSLAGHAFWYFIEEKYKKENVTFFLYLARTYKNVGKASMQITKKSFKALTAEFMQYESDKYDKDITHRKPYPKGNFVDGFDITSRENYYRFNVNPNKKNNSYVVTQFKKGIVRVILNDDNENTTILKYGVRTYENQMNPNYPMMAWDPKGTRISVVYNEKGRLYLFIYDVLTMQKKWDIDLTDKFDQIQDIKYLLDSRTILLSAVKNGHTDIFTFDLEKEKVKQITNDIYDNLDPAFVTFPNKTGIIFASNRSSASAVSNDTVLPCNNRYNIFLITNFGDKPELNQISQLTDLKYGNARFPAQYNVNHFTFVSDENGIANRYAGFFTTKKLGLDTLVLIGGDILTNPTTKEIDSTLRVQKKTAVDSIAVISVSADSSYTFPLSNYESNLAETRTAGDDRMLSEVTRQGDQKSLYKLKIDEFTLNKRNITAQPTEYGKKLMRESKRTNIKSAKVSNSAENSGKQNDSFQTEFGEEKKDSANIGILSENIVLNEGENDMLSRAKLYHYKPIKFSVDFGSVGFNTAVMFNKYQPYGNGSGPIMLSSNTPLNGLITMGTSDLMEDKRIFGGFKIGTNLKDNEWLVSYQNVKKRIDWGATYYRNALGTSARLVDNQGNVYGDYPAKLFTNLYQFNISYPFDVTKSIRITTGIRTDNLAVSNYDQLSASLENQETYYSVSHLEYVYDNSLNRSNNIMNGLRYKAFVDWNRQVGKIYNGVKSPAIFNFGFDARYYYPIYKNFIWAGRAAGDFSWGKQKFIYYLGGVDGWLMFGNNTKPGSTRERYFNTANVPDANQNYAFQSLALNMRGYIQNAANGNNAVVINSEFRLPVLSTLFDKTVSNAFLRDLQLTQFIDLGTAWTGSVKNMKRPESTFSNGQVTVTVKEKGVGPFVGGYGFGARSTLLGYFVKYDVGWPMKGFFNTRPVMYVSLGLDF